MTDMTEQIKQRIRGMLGLCMRAGGMKTGEAACEQTIKRGGAALLLVDEGISERGKKQLQDACAMTGVKMILLPVDMLGEAIGKTGRMAACITDKRFAERIHALAAQLE